MINMSSGLANLMKLMHLQPSGSATRLFYNPIIETSCEITVYVKAETKIPNNVPSASTATGSYLKSKNQKMFACILRLKRSLTGILSKLAHLLLSEYDLVTFLSGVPANVIYVSVK